MKVSQKNLLSGEFLFVLGLLAVIAPVVPLLRTGSLISGCGYDLLGL